MKARKLKVGIIMDNDWMYCVYRNRGQGSINLGVKSLGRFSKKIYMHFAQLLQCLWSYFDETYITFGL